MLTWLKKWWPVLVVCGFAVAALDTTLSSLFYCHPVGPNPGGSAQQQQTNEYCSAFNGPILVSIFWVLKTLHEYEGAVTGVFTIVLAVFTGRLWVSTEKLWQATNRLASDAKTTAENQAADTRILQRAYVSVNPLGVARFTSGQAFFSCDVGFENVGHLPARNVRWFIDRMFDHNPFFRGTVIQEDRFQGNGNVIAPGVEMRRGSERIDSAAFYAGARRPGATWFYVWGEVRYFDGFGIERFTKFCFRYNMAGVSQDPGKEGVPKENARYHVHGNDAD